MARFVREAVGGLDALQEAVDCLEAYHQFQPEHVDRRTINAHWVWLFRNDTELNKINILQRNMLEKRPLRG